MTEQIKFDGTAPSVSTEIDQTERDITCCFTGHRDIPETPELYSAVRHEIINAYRLGYRIFCAGGAMGFDTVAALNTLAMREKDHPDIKLHLILPYPDQHIRWGKEKRELYENILKKADKVEYVSDSYSKWCFMERNKQLVLRSSHCICYMTSPKSGTAYTVRLSEKNGLSIVNIAEI